MLNYNLLQICTSHHAPRFDLHLEPKSAPVSNPECEPQSASRTTIRVSRYVLRLEPHQPLFRATIRALALYVLDANHAPRFEPRSAPRAALNSEL
jgi:hypothetical protein